MDTVKGFRDYTGEEALKREKIKQVFIKNFKLYGFEPAETPIIENREFVQGDNPNDEAVSDTFRLQDKGKRKLALRYELTFPLKRIAKNKKLPYKRYQIGPVFRDEPVTSNRWRQFIQLDIDTIGSTIKDDADIVVLTLKIMKELGITAEMNINNRKLINEILDEQKIKNKEAVIREIDKLDKQPEADVRKNLKKYKADKILTIIKKPRSFFKKYESYKEILELERYCKMQGVKVNFQPSLARGLAYYNRTVFELKIKGMKETIAGGGGYMINRIQSTGISFGLERISQLAKIPASQKRILIISINQDKKAIQLADKLRKQNIACSIFYGKPTKALDYANSLKIPYVIFLGEKEVKRKKVKLRNMKTGREKLISENKIAI